MIEKHSLENYLQVLEESLHKKMSVLSRIEDVNIRQEQILKAEAVSEDDFDRSIDEKGMLIEELQALDHGFEALYEHIQEQLTENRERYKHQIPVLQKLIGEVTDKSVSIQAQEARNKVLAERFFASRKQELQKGRKSSRAALDYYLSMSQSQVVPPQFMDKKK